MDVIRIMNEQGASNINLKGFLVSFSFKLTMAGEAGGGGGTWLAQAKYLYADIRIGRGICECGYSG